jgi:hypothetical protein
MWDMKKTNTKNQNGLKLERRLALVRTTIRELNPNQLEEVNGGSNLVEPTTCNPLYTI